MISSLEKMNMYVYLPTTYSSETLYGPSYGFIKTLFSLKRFSRYIKLLTLSQVVIRLSLFLKI